MSLAHSSASEPHSLSETLDGLSDPGADPETFLRPRKAARQDWLRAGFFAALGAGLLALLALAAWHLVGSAIAVMTPFLIGLALALMLEPLKDWLHARLHIPRLLAVCLVFTALLVLIAVVVYYGIPAVITQATSLMTNGPGFVERIREGVNTFLAHHRHIATYSLPKNFNALTSKIGVQLGQLLQNSSGSIAGYLLGSMQALLDILVGLIVTFYLLLDLERLRARAFYIIPASWRGTMDQICSAVGHVFSGYLRGVLTVAVLFAISTTAIIYGMSLAHRPLAGYALLIGVVAGIISVIPYLGALTTGLLLFLVAFPLGGLGFGVLGLALIAAQEQVYDNIITPRIVGGRVGLHPLLALFSIFLFGHMFGFWGLLLGSPIAGSIQAVLYQFFPHLQHATPAPFLRVQGVHPDKRDVAEERADIEGRTDAEGDPNAALEPATNDS
jgi:predicted PurR-regulated permease PerM